MKTFRQAKQQKATDTEALMQQHRKDMEAKEKQMQDDMARRAEEPVN